LDFAYNRCNGQLPNDIPKQMPNLQILLMENNDIGRAIPANHGSLNLRRVHMDDNAFTGTIPTELGQPPRMKQLFLHGNQLMGMIPSELKNLNVLNQATFHYNSLAEQTIDNEICEL
jgi:Leucine-rich repeat (LRR) protein